MCADKLKLCCNFR